MRGMFRRNELDFSDYLELRRLHDSGDLGTDGARLLSHLEAALGVTFASAIPNMITLDDAPAAPPRDLTRGAVRVAFAMREEFAQHGRVRAAMMGFDLPDGAGLKDWLDLVETERKHAMHVRKALRELDGKIWRMFTGERKPPSIAQPRMLI